MIIDFLLGSLVNSAPAKIVEGAGKIRRARLKDEAYEQELARERARLDARKALEPSQ